MSADNWGICPRCKKIWDADHGFAVQKVKDAYGKVDIEKYESLRKEAMQVIQMPDSQSLREDYEIGIRSNGEFYVNYSGHCTTCGFDYQHQFNTQVTT